MQKGEHFACAEFIVAAGMRTDTNYHVETTGEFRKPRIGEWYIAVMLMGCYVAEELQPEVNIARLVEAPIPTPEIQKVQPLAVGRIKRYAWLRTRRGYKPVSALLLALCLTQASFEEEIEISDREEKWRMDHADV